MLRLAVADEELETAKGQRGNRAEETALRMLVDLASEAADRQCDGACPGHWCVGDRHDELLQRGSLLPSHHDQLPEDMYASRMVSCEAMWPRALCSMCTIDRWVKAQTSNMRWGPTIDEVRARDRARDPAVKSISLDEARQLELVDELPSAIARDAAAESRESLFNCVVDWLEEEVDPSLQRFFNLKNHDYAVRESLDLKHQIFLEDDGRLSTVAYHKLSEVQIVPTWYNYGKSNGFEGTFDVVVAAVHLHQAGHSVDPLISLLNWSAPVKAASINRSSLSDSEVISFVEDIRWWESAFGPEGNKFMLVPEPTFGAANIGTALASYPKSPDEDTHVMKQLEHREGFLRLVSQDEERNAVLFEDELEPLPRNDDGFPCVFRPSASEEDIWRLCLRVLHRANEVCDQASEPNPANSAMGVLFLFVRHWANHRERDPFSGLPIDFSMTPASPRARDPPPAI